MIRRLVAGAGLAAGLACDAWLNRSPWSWLPFALGLPLVPAFGWTAVRGNAPDGLAALVALGALAGAALALANGLADFDADTSVGRGGLAYRLGRRRSQHVPALLQATLLVVAAVAESSTLPLGRHAGSGSVPSIIAGTARELRGFGHHPGARLGRAADRRRVARGGLAHFDGAAHCSLKFGALAV